MRKLIIKLLYLLIMYSFLFDSYYKFTYLSRESDMLRSKYHLLQELLVRTCGFSLPYDV